MSGNRANIQAVSAGVALLLLAMSIAWWLLNEDQVVPVEVPTYSGDPVEVKTAAVPSIGDFTREFNVNAENPFVPIQLRDPEREAITKPRPKKNNNPQASTPPHVENVPVPKLVLPGLAPRRKNAPECIGIISSEHGDLLLAHMPGAAENTPLEVGHAVAESSDASKQWTLIALEQGNVARFRDPTGAEQLFAIGAPIGTGSAGGSNPTAVPAPKAPIPKPHSGLRPPRPAQDPQGAPLPQGGTTDHPQGWSPRPAEPPTFPQQQQPPPPAITPRSK